VLYRPSLSEKRGDGGELDSVQVRVFLLLFFIAIIWNIETIFCKFDLTRKNGIIPLPFMFLFLRGPLKTPLISLSAQVERVGVSY
jgi:hypothetical protein